ISAGGGGGTLMGGWLLALSDQAQYSTIFMHIRFDKMSKNPLELVLYADLLGRPKHFLQAVSER
ncbi:MAG: hypothetical protein ACYS8I_10305, partial [Planctomycetota bacterium]